MNNLICRKQQKKSLFAIKLEIKFYIIVPVIYFIILLLSTRKGHNIINNTSTLLNFLLSVILYYAETKGRNGDICIDNIMFIYNFLRPNWPSWPLWNTSIRFADESGYVFNGVTTIMSPFPECNLPNWTLYYRLCTNMSKTNKTLPKSPQVFCGVCIIQSLVFINVVFVYYYFSVGLFFFNQGAVSLWVWMPIWYLSFLCFVSKYCNENRAVGPKNYYLYVSLSELLYERFSKNVLKYVK